MTKTKKKDRQYEYYVRETAPGEFEVSKFDSMEGGEQPLSTYNVKYDPPRQLGKCNCHAATYRGTANIDKHVKIVERWIELGKQAIGILWPPNE